MQPDRVIARVVQVCREAKRRGVWFSWRTQLVCRLYIIVTIFDQCWMLDVETNIKKSSTVGLNGFHHHDGWGGGSRSAEIVESSP